MRPGSSTRSLSLECLEARVVPALFEVVPASGANGFTTFANLQNAVDAARSGDVVQVEPGSSPGDSYTNPGVTIQGDPAFGVGGLQASNTLVGTLTLQTPNVTVRGLFLNAVLIAPTVTGETIANNVFNTSNVLANGIQQTFSQNAFTAAFNGGNTVVGNTFLFGAIVQLGNTPGDPRNEASDDRVLDNVFTYGGGYDALRLSNETAGLQVSGNKFVKPDDAGAAYAIVVTDCSGVIQGNTIHTSSVDGMFIGDTRDTSQAINLQATNIVVENNVITTGLHRAVVIGHRSTHNTFVVKVSNNALAGNQPGLLVSGNGAGGALDYGTLTINGNDFRGYMGGVDNDAILVYDSTNTSTINAQGNIFSVANPQTTVLGAPGTVIDTSNPLTGGTATLTAMFLTLAGGPPPSATTQALASSTATVQAAAAIRSNQAVTAFVDTLYVSFLGRTPAGGEDQYWVNLVMGGGTQEQVIVGFATSAEYYRQVTQASPNPNGTWVQSLYLNLLGRQGATSEINYWLGVAQSQGLAAVATGIVASQEFRSLQVEAYYGVPPVGVVPAPDLLKRGTFPAAWEISYWASQSSDLLAIQARILATSEFATNG